MPLVSYKPFRELQEAECDLEKLLDTDWGSWLSFTESATMDMYEEGSKANKTEAMFKDGILKITMPTKRKKEANKVTGK